VSNSADSRPPETSDRHSAVPTSMLLVGTLVAMVSLLYLPTLLMSQANTQAELIVKASDKWITLGVDASNSQVPTALSQYEVIQPIGAKQTRPRHKDSGLEATSPGVHSRAQVSGKPRSSVASACPNITQRGASDMANSECARNRQHAATLRVAKNQRSRPSTLA
jgi:hypothetical protein